MLYFVILKCEVEKKVTHRMLRYFATLECEVGDCETCHVYRWVERIPGGTRELRAAEEGGARDGPGSSTRAEGRRRASGPVKRRSHTTRC